MGKILYWLHLAEGYSLKYTENSKDKTSRKQTTLFLKKNEHETKHVLERRNING